MIESIVIWGVIWFAVMLAAVPLLAATGSFIGDHLDNGWDGPGLVVGGVTGWVLGAIVSIFSAIQVILHIIHLVQEASA